MKRSFGFALILALLSIPAFAAKNSQSINIIDPVTIGSTKLPAGEYKVTWTGTAPNVQVTIEQKGAQHPISATVPAKLMTEKHDHTQLTTNTHSGVITLENIQLKDVTLNLVSAPVSGQ
jgi:hypothetical protein